MVFTIDDIGPTGCQGAHLAAYVSAEMRRAVDELARANKILVSNLIRQMIQHCLDEAGKPDHAK